MRRRRQRRPMSCRGSSAIVSVEPAVAGLGGLVEERDIVQAQLFEGSSTSRAGWRASCRSWGQRGVPRRSGQQRTGRPAHRAASARWLGERHFAAHTSSSSAQPEVAMPDDAAAAAHFRANVDFHRWWRPRRPSRLLRRLGLIVDVVVPAAEVPSAEPTRAGGAGEGVVDISSRGRAIRGSDAVDRDRQRADRDRCRSSRLPTGRRRRHHRPVWSRCRRPPSRSSRSMSTVRR